jgi:hypothetical protein
MTCYFTILDESAWKSRRCERKERGKEKKIQSQPIYQPPPRVASL